MHVPVQVDYGIRALVDLAQHSDRSAVRASEIARRQGIPPQYLARVLHSLQRHGLTKAQRGPLGGHSLARRPSEITMGAVLACLGGTVSLVMCLDDAGSCEQSSCCGQQSVWREAEAAMWKVLNATTIADVVERMSVSPRERVPA